MLLTMPVFSMLARSSRRSNSLQVERNGARPLSGKANTEFSRADSNSVSPRCKNGDEADSAMKCGR